MTVGLPDWTVTLVAPTMVTDVEGARAGACGTPFAGLTELRLSGARDLTGQVLAGVPATVTAPQRR
jgi:hypothetical protein